MRTSERTNLHLVRRPPAWWCCRRTGGGSVDTEASSKKGSCGLRATQAVLCVVCGRSVAGDGETAERRRAMVAIPLWRCAEAEGGESRPRHEHRSWLTTKRPVLRQMPRGGAVSPGAGLSQGGGSIDLPSPVVGRGLDSSSVSVGRSVGGVGRWRGRASGRRRRSGEEEEGREARRRRRCSRSDDKRGEWAGDGQNGGATGAAGRRGGKNDERGGVNNEHAPNAFNYSTGTAPAGPPVGHSDRTRRWLAGWLATDTQVGPIRPF